MYNKFLARFRWYGDFFLSSVGYVTVCVVYCVTIYKVSKPKAIESSNESYRLQKALHHIIIYIIEWC